MPLYHALLVVGEAIGNSGQSTIQEISIADTKVSGYAIYEKNKLVRVVLINGNLYLSSDSQPRSQATVSLQGLPANARIQAKRLTIPSADATTGNIWAGQSFETVSGRPSGRLLTEVVHASNITISATEVVLLTIQ
jgi:hypothetical protein